MKSPFKFLDSYTKEDRDIFFGREREIEELYHRVFESKIMLVYGISGTGKSSLIHCGLANKFQETDWLPLVIRRGGNILENLAAAIKAASITPQTGEILAPLHFKKAVRSLYLDHYKPVFFIFDQFEELFIFGNKDEKRSFIQTIKTIVDSEIQCRFIFVMREEYMASFTEFERYIPFIFQNRVRIEKMSHINALEAIKGPCKVAGINVEDGFAETLLEKLSPESADVELTYLQVFLDRIFRSAAENYPAFERNQGRQAGASFTISLLSQIGDVSDLLGSFLDEQISLLSDPDTGLAVLKSFVSIKGTKQPMKVEEVKDYVMTLGRNPDERSLSEMIQAFVSLRILCDKDQHDRYELRHDALAAKIYEKFTLVEKELLEVRKFVENAFYSFETRGILLNKDDLDYLAGYENKLILPQNLNEFVNQSRQKLFARRKALTNMTRISALVFILLIAAIIRYYLSTQSSAREYSQIGGFLLQSESNPAKGLLSTLELWEKYNNSTVLKRIIFSDFQKLLKADADSSEPLSLLQRQFSPVEFKSEIIKADLSENGKYIFGWLKNLHVFVYNQSTNKNDEFIAEGEPVNIELSEKDSLVAIVYKKGNGAIYDFKGNKRYSFLTTLNEVMNKRLVHFLPDSIYQLAVVKDKEADIYDFNGRLVFSLYGHRERINSIDVSSDGKFLATASADKKVYIWRYNNENKHYNLFDSLAGHRDTVWSCEFNKSGKYILTASADSTIRIWNLLGQQTKTQYFFGYNYQNFMREKNGYGENPEDITDTSLSSYSRKCCNASFTSDEFSVVATNYTLKKDFHSGKINEFNQVLYYDLNSYVVKDHYTVFSGFFDFDETLIPETIDHLAVSPHFEIAATANNRTHMINLLGPDGLILTTFNGIDAMFTVDGKYLFIIYGNRISKFPADIKEIKNYLDKFKISGNIKTKNKLRTAI